MFKLAHFSDPHIGPLPQPKLHELLSKRITGYINYRKNRGKSLTDNTLQKIIDDLKQQAPDHIALTGDIVNLALPQEMENARAFLDSIESGENLSLVGGNHDAYIPGAFETAKRLWKPYFLGDDASKVKFPYIRQKGNIAIIGLSTACATLPFMATGTLGNAQLSKSEEVLAKAREDNLFRVVLIHHPPFKGATHWYKRLTDGHRFMEVLKRNGAELVLHGHTHKRSKIVINGANGKIPIIGVPSASSGLAGHHEPARFNLFEITTNGEEASCIHIERGLTSNGDIAELEREVLI